MSDWRPFLYGGFASIVAETGRCHFLCFIYFILTMVLICFRVAKCPEFKDSPGNMHCVLGKQKTMILLKNDFIFTTVSYASDALCVSLCIHVCKSNEIVQLFKNFFDLKTSWSI